MFVGVLISMIIYGITTIQASNYVLIIYTSQHILVILRPTSITPNGPRETMRQKYSYV